jgi:hypothetical protein
MEPQIYTRKQVKELVHRYNAGDLAAGAQVNALVKGRQRETGEDYADALRFVLRTTAAKYSRHETDPVTVRNAGVELAAVAQNIQRTERVVFACGNVKVGKVSHKEALQLAILSNPILGAQYTGHDILPDREAYEQVKRNYGEGAR